MYKPEDNLHELKDFVNKHDLQDRFSNILFDAIVSIRTSQNKLTNERMQVRITFDDYDSYGKVTLLENDLDPNLYPTVFEAKWNKMEHVDQEFLFINDTHKKNSRIGQYSVKITPTN